MKITTAKKVLAKRKRIPVNPLMKLASKIAKREGKKSQAKIGDIREILKIIVELLTEDSVASMVVGKENYPLAEKIADNVYDRAIRIHGKKLAVALKSVK